MVHVASDNRTWTCEDPWQYITCLPGPSVAPNPFDVAEEVIRVQQESFLNRTSDPSQHPTIPAQLAGQGKEGNQWMMWVVGVLNAPKRPGACRLFNKAPGGCPYGKNCIFMHYCSNFGALNEHSQMASPFPPWFPPCPSNQQF